MSATYYSTTDPTDRFVGDDTITLLPKSQAEIDAENQASLFDRRHRAKKAKRSSKKTPEFVMRVPHTEYSGLT
jgi:hypothetical protein